MRYFCYVLRMPRTYGFGVQSPFAYHFIRQVVKAHYNHPYVYKHRASDFKHSAYQESFTLVQSLSRYASRKQRFYKLLFRLTVFIEADRCYVSNDRNDLMMCDIIRAAGCHVVSDLSAAAKIKFSVIYADCLEYDRLLDCMSSDGMLVVFGIRRNAKALDFWNLLISDCRTFVSFDLYDLGVIFFDPKMYKRNYCCNVSVIAYFSFHLILTSFAPFVVVLMQIFFKTCRF